MMISSIGLTLLIFSITIVSTLNDPKCGRLSNRCELKSFYCNYYPNHTKCHMYVCDRIDASFQFEPTEMQLIRNCSSNNPDVEEALENVYFRLVDRESSSFLDGSFDLFNNELFLTSKLNKIYDGLLYDFDSYLHSRMTFRFVKGFDVGKFKPRNISTRFDFYYSNFDFYLNRSLIRSCDDLKNLTEHPHYVFDSFKASCFRCYNDFRFYNCEYKRNICPLTIGISMALKKAAYLRFIGIQNTFYKSNFPRFQPILNSTYMFNLSRKYIFVANLDITNMQNIELNSDILDRFLFYNVYHLRLYGDIVSIEKGLFKSFKRLKVIHIDLLSIRKVMNRGIDWIFDLNSDINVDFQNISLASRFNEEMLVQIYLNTFNEQGVKKKTRIYFNDYFPDEDFCLYARLPFQQLVIIYFINLPGKDMNYNCIVLWIRFNQKILFDFFNGKTGYYPNSTNYNKCNFNKR